MAGDNVQEVNVDEIMRKIREEVIRRKAETQRPDGRTERPGHVPKKEDASLHQKDNMELADLTVYHDEEFVENVYRAVLKREPDAGGFNNYLAKLRTGRLSKTEVIGRIRFSKEGRQKRVNIKGLAPRFLILSSFQIPVLGYLLNLAAAALRLPAILRNVHEYESFTSARFTRQRRDLDDAFAKAEQNLNRGMDALKSKVDAQNLREQLALKTDIEYIKTLLARKADSEDVSQQFAALSEKIDRKADVGELSKKADAEAVSEGLASKADAEAVSQQLSALSEEIARKADADTMNNRLKSKADAEIVDGQLAGLHKEIAKKENIPVKDHALDAMYAAFEDRFRGTREDIKERLEAYLPYVEKLKKDKPLLDLGSGRGEWLELVKEHGYRARGVDANRVMVRQCTERGLDAVESDALEYLRNQRKGSFSAVTGFHIVEHLPLKTLVMLVDESLRVLCPGGMVIFETPNPENLIVGACNFYTDPTHRNPIPPHTLRFLLEARGFGKTEIIRLHPYAYYKDLLEGSEGIRELAAFFHKEQDYSVVACKV